MGLVPNFGEEPADERDGDERETGLGGGGSDTATVAESPIGAATTGSGEGRLHRQRFRLQQSRLPERRRGQHRRLHAKLTHVLHQRPVRRARFMIVEKSARLSALCAANLLTLVHFA